MYTSYYMMIELMSRDIYQLEFEFFYFEGFTSIPTALTANDRNRRIQVYQASDG